MKKSKKKKVNKSTPVGMDINFMAIARAKSKKKKSDNGVKIEFKAPKLFNGVVPEGETAAIAMDDALSTYSWLNQAGIGEYQPFPGYPYLASLSTRAEYRTFAQVISSELFRKWIEFSSTAGDGDNDKNERIKELEERIDNLRLKEVFTAAAVNECYFGRGQIVPVFKQEKDFDLPLIVSNKTIQQGSLKTFKAIEPIWTTPASYNANNPTDDDFYKPNKWFIMGRQIDASWIETIITRPLPDILKPAYNFSGMSLSQLAEPYVNNWLRTRQSVSDLINKFSLTAIKTDMNRVLTGSDDGESLDQRIELMQAYRSNEGILALDMNREDIMQINTPLSGLSELQAQSQEHLCSVSRIPSMIYTGISPTGMNASSEGEIRSFYDFISSMQEVYYPALDRSIKIIQLDLWGEIDPEITFKFKSLWQMSELDASTIRLNRANEAAAYIDRQVLSQDEVRENIAADKDSGWDNIDINREIEFEGDFELDPLAEDKSVSEKQHRAMAAAAAGHSTLGIPKKVGEDFISKDELPDGLSLIQKAEHHESQVMALDAEINQYKAYAGELNNNELSDVEEIIAGLVRSRDEHNAKAFSFRNIAGNRD